MIISPAPYWFVFFTVVCCSLRATSFTVGYSTRFLGHLSTIKHKCRHDRLYGTKWIDPTCRAGIHEPMDHEPRIGTSLKMIQDNINNDDDSNGDTDVSTSNDQMVDADTADSSSSLLESLRSRQEQLAKGIGKRYITRTQKGFLNIHSNPESGPYAVDNIVGQLSEGQIVTSKGKFEDWIQHDAGGWSIAEFGGFIWLQPIDE